MIITNWLARDEGNYGLVFPDEFKKTKMRIYGNVYGHPNFQDGEYVQTGRVEHIIRDVDLEIITTAGEKFRLQNRDKKVYLKYLNARYSNLIILKYWKVVNGLLVGKTIDGAEISGRVISQNISENICKFEDGSLVFVDWLSKDESFVPQRGMQEFLLFGIEKCMPDIFGKHFSMFRKK